METKPLNPTQEAIGALYGAPKATVSRALDDAQAQAQLNFAPTQKMDYLEYDISVSLLQASVQYLFKEESLPVSLDHVAAFAAIHLRLENFLCRLLDLEVRSLRKELEKASRLSSEQGGGIEISA